MPLWNILLKRFGKRRVLTFISGCAFITLSLFFFLGQKIKSVEIPSVELMDGDIIFQASDSEQAGTMKILAGGTYNHAGILFRKGSAYYVYEASQPVKMTLMANWIKNGENGRYVVKRLKDAGKILSAGVIDKMKDLSEQHKGKDYDNFYEWSDERMYNAELIWKIYKESAGIELSRPEHLKDFNLSDTVIVKNLKEHFGRHLPLNEPVVSTPAIFESGYLITVIQN